MFIPHLFNQWGRVSTTQPLSRPVKSNDFAYTAHTGLAKLGWRHLRRLVYYKLSGQQAFYREGMDPAWRHGLWLYCGVPQVGDALMDLAPRTLLDRHGLTIDLCTELHLAQLFEGDPWFRRVFSLDSSKPDTESYDFVIVQSHKSRSLRQKCRRYRSIPWISMQGFYTGPEFHRAEFATQRLIDVMARQSEITLFYADSRQKLKSLPPRPSMSTASLNIAFGLGGVDPLRTYTSWLALAEQLSILFDLKVTLLGSGNAVEEAKDFAARFRGQVDNRVNKTTLDECRALMQAQDVVVACDGGLMHLAVTTQACLVSMFHAGVRPDWRLPPNSAATSLQSATGSVNGIATASIVAMIESVAYLQPRAHT